MSATPDLRSAPRVVVTGEYFCDLVFGRVAEAPAPGREVFGDDLKIVPGGTFNIAAGLAAAGVETAWACQFGTDVFSAFVRARALEYGVSSAAFEDLPYDTPRLSAAFTKDGDRGFLSSSLEPVRPVPFAELAPDWVVQTFRYGPEWIEAAARAKAGGAKLYGDARDCDASLDDADVCSLLETFDVFAPSETEAMRLTGRETRDAALTELSRIVPTVIVTCAGDGAVFATADGQRGHVAAPRVAAVDPIGAGDAFNVGFLTARLAGLGVSDCVETGCLFGSYAVTRSGGGDPPDLAAIERFARKHGVPLLLHTAERTGGADPIETKTQRGGYS